jgi:D-alanyl-D-alanine dipeptidase
VRALGLTPSRTGCRRLKPARIRKGAAYPGLRPGLFSVARFAGWELVLNVIRRLSIGVVVAAALTVLTQQGAAQQASVQTFKITPLKPVAELRREALAAKPPEEKGPFRKPELVELVKLDPTIKLDIRYASTNNFMGTPFYDQARAFLQRPAAEAVARVNRKLKAQGYGLIIHDGYRPWYVTKMFWDGTPADKHQYVADPQEGSRHNRGCAVDLSLYDLKTGQEVEMPSGYDEMSERAHADYAGGTPDERRLRDLLRREMEAAGFQVYPFEWWHFDYKDWKEYPILNLTFDQIQP